MVVSLAPPLRAQAFVFDPDRCVTCTDTRDHALAGAGIDAGLQVVAAKFSPLARAGLVFVVGAAYEFGQESLVREDVRTRGPGYGFGVKDLLADVVGALVAEGLGAAWRRLR